MTVTGSHNLSKRDSASDRRFISIAKNSGFGVIGQTFLLFMRFFTAILITRTLGAKDYGIYLLAFNINIVLRIVALLGFEPAMVKFVAQYKAQRDNCRLKGVIKFGLAVSAAAGLLLALLVFACSDTIATNVFNVPRLSPVMRVMLLSLPLWTVFLVMLAVLQGAKQVKYKILIEELILPLFRFTAIAVAVTIGLKLIGLAWIWTITSLIGTILALIFFQKVTKFTSGADARVDGKEILSFSLPLLFSRLFAKNTGLVVMLLIGIFYPIANVGVYGVAMKVIPFLTVPFMAYITIFDPIVSDLYTKGDIPELEKVYKTGTRWVLSASLPLFSIVAIFASQIASIFGSDFKESAAIMIVLSVGQLINAVAGPVGGILKMTGKSLYNLMNSAILFVLTIGLTLLMMKPLGIIGAAYASCIAIFVVNVVQTLEVWYLYKIHPYSQEYVKPIFSCIISVVATYFLSRALVFHNGIIALIIFSMLFMIVYLTLLVISGLAPEDRMILTKLRYKLLTVVART